MLLEKKTKQNKKKPGLALIGVKTVTNTPQNYHAFSGFSSTTAARNEYVQRYVSSIFHRNSSLKSDLPINPLSELFGISGLMKSTLVLLRFPLTDSLSPISKQGLAPPQLIKKM